MTEVAQDPAAHRIDVILSQFDGRVSTVSFLEEGTRHARAPSTRRPSRLRPHDERHRSGRAGWLRAAVLGSDDAIVSTASLMIGVAASAASMGAVLTAGVAGLVAGAEYVIGHALGATVG